MSEVKTFKTGPWELDYMPADGARLSRLTFEGHDLLTTAPADFRPPQADYGKYELRPVFGYDDCFPSIRACEHPQQPGVQVADHGEVCWLQWDITASDNRLDFNVASKVHPGISFRRSVIFTEDCLTWEIEVTNDSAADFAFIHVIHPLMPPTKITSIKLPDFAKVTSEMQEGIELPCKTGEELAAHLMSQPNGSADFMLVKDVKAGEVVLGFEGGFSLALEYDPKMLPVLGIWWNRKGYPAEDGIQRSECAFEPLPSYTSSLNEAIKGKHLWVGAGKSKKWQLHWRILR